MTTRLKALVVLLLLLPSVPIGADTLGAQAPSSAWRYPQPERIVAVADVHGAHDELVALLQATGIIDRDHRWIGGGAHLVSLGDLLDRGSRSREVMELLMRLTEEAPAAGGRVHVVLGNHELMNVIGDLRYVSADEYAAFALEEPPGVRSRALTRYLSRGAEKQGSDAGLREAFDRRHPPGYFGHRAAFAPDGRYGRWLLSLPAMVVVGDTLFVHGGLPATITGAGLDAVNARVRQDMADYQSLWRELVDIGVLPADDAGSAPESARAALVLAEPSECIEERQVACERARDAIADPDRQTIGKLEAFIAVSGAPLLSGDGPLWYRGSVSCRPILEAPLLTRVLGELRASRVVVGHTPTLDRRVRSLYGGRLIMLDTGMLTSYYHGRPAALQIDDDAPVVQYLSPVERSEPLSTDRPRAYGLGHSALLRALADGEIVSVDEEGADGTRRVKLSFEAISLSARYYPPDRRRSHAREVAAYRLDRQLGLELVPPTVMRRLDGREGALQLIEPGAITETERLAQGRVFGGWCPMARQIELMKVFDLLIGNRQRTRDDLYFQTPAWRIGLTGHGRAFDRNGKLPPGPGDATLTLAPLVSVALAGLTREQLDAAVGDLLSSREASALIRRRDEMLSRFGPAP